MKPWCSWVACCAPCFWPDYFVNEAFRRELLHVLNRGESVNSLKRSLYVGRVANYQAKQHDEMQGVADALSLLANIVMAWNTMKMQAALDRSNARRASTVPPELIGRISLHAHGRYQPARCVRFPRRAVRRAIAAVTGGIKITGRWRLKSPRKRREMHL
jgi:hypothetical protein